jgi:hypothetical protein
MTSGFDGFARRLQAQLDQRMEEMATNAVDLILLEAAWKDDLKCVSLHTDHGPCSIEVTHYLTDCVSEGPLCTVSAEYVQRAKDANLECDGCGEPCGDHIRLWPI